MRLDGHSVTTPHALALESLGILTSLPCFSKLPERIASALVQQSRIHTFEKGKNLYVQGETAEAVYIVLSGWVKIFRETIDGKEAIIDVFSTDNLVGETSILNNFIYTESAEVVETARLLTIPAVNFKNLLHSEHGVVMALLQSMTNARNQRERELEHRVLQNAPQRIGCFLLRLCPNQNAKKPVTLSLPFDKALIANRLGMQPETFSRALGKLRDDLGLVIKGSEIEIKNIEELSDYVCGMCSSTFPCADLSCSTGCNKCSHT